jgi:glycosyltransferase involved in cell wall biosynthesis
VAQPLVSIVIPLYNAEKFISETLDSVLAQTYQNWECIIVDDGSKDASKEQVAEYCLKDKRFQYHWQPNSGASSARNKGIELSKGQFIQYLDADDLILPDKIRNMLEESEKIDGKGILYSDMILGKEDNIREKIPLRFSLNLGSDITFDQTYRRYAIDFGITPTCFLFPREVTDFAFWDIKLGPAEDWDYFLQILNKGYYFRFLPETLVLYRNTAASYSKNIARSLKSHYKVLGSWAVKTNSNWYHFSKRCALLYQESILYWIFNKSDRIYKPVFPETIFTLRQKLFVLLIYPLTGYFLVSTFLTSLIKRIKQTLLRSKFNSLNICNL